MFLILLAVLSTAILSVFLYRKYLKRNDDYWKKRGVLQVEVSKIAPTWKWLTFQVPLHVVDQEIYKAIGEAPYGGFHQFGNPTLYVKDMDLLKRIMVKDFEFFSERRKLNIEKTDKIFSKMLSIVNGPEWKELRSAVSPAFTTSKIKAMFQFFNACGHQMAAYLKESGQEEANFQDVFGRFTLGAIASIAFGFDAGTFGKEESTFRKMFQRMQKFSALRVAKFMLHMFMPKLASALRVSISDKESIDYFCAILERVIKHRRETGDKRQDFLQLMLDVQCGRLKMEEKDVAAMDEYEKEALLTSESGKVKQYALDFDDLTVLAQSILFFMAGADTLESLLVFTAYELALNQEVQEKLAQEVTSFMDEHGGDINYEGAQGLPYLDMVICESLRFHPPAFATERRTVMDYKIPDTDVVIPKGCIVTMSINGIHKDPRYYPEPEKFNPENFTPENRAKRHPYTWSPFGQGPRNCIAMRFALLEAKAAIAHLVYNFKVEPCAKTDIPLQLSHKSGGLRKPANGMWLKFTPRRTTEGTVKENGHRN